MPSPPRAAPIGLSRLLRAAVGSTSGALEDGASGQCTAERTATTPDALPSGASRSRSKRKRRAATQDQPTRGPRRRDSMAEILDRTTLADAGNARLDEHLLGMVA